MHECDSERWNTKVQAAIRESVKTDEQTGCWTWTGPTSRTWDYPVVLVEGQVINIRQWNADAKFRKAGFVSFFHPVCGNATCIRNSHMRLLLREPTATVRLAEVQNRSARAGTCR